MLYCPICKQKLILNDKVYKCVNNHSFDVARKGYVNLLVSQTSRQHGDDKSMSVSRRDFLNKGYYSKLLANVCDALGSCKTILDLGCGECYYSQGIKNSIVDSTVVSIDISKTIIETGSARIRESGIIAAVANCSKLPLGDGEFDAVLSVFAPVNNNELKRVTNTNGIFVSVTPGPLHLFELKSSVYDKPNKNPIIDVKLDGFIKTDSRRLRYKFFIDNNQDVLNLFSMTPYYYKTSKADMDKLKNISTLEVTADFYIDVFRKQSS